MVAEFPHVGNLPARTHLCGTRCLRPRMADGGVPKRVAWSENAFYEIARWKGQSQNFVFARGQDRDGLGIELSSRILILVSQTVIIDCARHENEPPRLAAQSADGLKNDARAKAVGCKGYGGGAREPLV